MSDFRDVQRAFAEYVRDPRTAPPPDGVRHDRLEVYRDAVYLNQLSLMGDNFPRLRTFYTDDEWQDLIRDYLAQHSSRSPAFIDVPFEFKRFLERRDEQGQNKYPFVVELADFECLETEVAADLQRIDERTFDTEGDLLNETPMLNPTCRLAVYDFPVHELTIENVAEHAEGKQTFIAAYRTLASEYRYVVLSALVASFIETLQTESTDAGGTGNDVARRVAQAYGLDVGEVAEIVLKSFTSFRENGLILGVAKRR